MQKFTFILIFVLSGLWFSCEKTKTSPDLGKLEGTWVEDHFEEDMMILNKSNEIQEDNYGFVIHDGGKFTEHKNSGSCGTPPISYSNFEGSWEYENDSTLKIVVGYWGGSMTYKLDIIELTEDNLKVRYHYQN